MQFKLRTDNTNGFLDLGSILKIDYVDNDFVRVYLDITTIDIRIYEVLLGINVIRMLGEPYFISRGILRTETVYLGLENHNTIIELPYKYRCVSFIEWPLELGTIELDFEVVDEL